MKRQDLVANPAKFLAPRLSAVEIEQFLTTGSLGPQVIVQMSSGSTGKEVLRIPRTLSDIQDIFKRTLIPYFQAFAKPPERIAMLGGVSHSEASLKFKLAATGFRSFRLDELNELQEYNPDLISCYPSVARELAGNENLKFPALNSMKLGGEHIYDADLKIVTERFGDLKFFEQVGSTEMPAVAIGFRAIEKERRIPLHTQRFAFERNESTDWQPLIVKDLFLDLILNINDFYDTGDEVRLAGDTLVDIRRANDPCFDFRELVESLLLNGVVDLQIDRLAKEIVVARLPGTNMDSVDYNGVKYRLRQAPLRRLKTSQKMPLILS